MEMYLLKSAACLAILLVFYKAFLEKESFHTFKRFYLLGALLISFCIPLITLIKYVEPELVLGSFLNPIDEAIMYPSAVATAVTDEVVKQPFDWSNLLWTVYGLGVLFFGIRFIINLSRIVRKIKSNTKTKRESFINVLLKDLVIPHTFFNYIFLNKSKFEKQEIPEEVLLHEQTHAKQKHSIDILIIELLQVLFWFNPILYLIKKDIKLNHEFLADQAVMDYGTSLTTYQQILLAFSSNATEPLPNNVGMANAINYSSIKKRFTVMKTQTSKKNLWVKSLVLLPLLTFMVYGFSTTKEIEKEVTPLMEINPTEKHTARSIDLKILEDGNYSVDGVKVSKSSLAATVNNLHQDITPEIRNNIMNIHVSSSKEVLKDEVWFIYNSLLDYGFYRIITPNQEIVRGKGNTPFKVSKLEHSTEANLSTKEIVIMVNNNKRILLNNRVTPLENFDRELSKSYSNLSKNERETQVVSVIWYEKGTDNSFVANLGTKLRKHGVKSLLIEETEIPEFIQNRLKLGVSPVLNLKLNPLRLKLNGKDTSMGAINKDFNALTNNIATEIFLDTEEIITVELLQKILKKIGPNATRFNIDNIKGGIKTTQKQVDNYNKLANRSFKTPTLNINNNGKTLTLNGINTSIKTLKKDFARITHGKKSELKITASKPFDIKLLETITNTITDKYLINLNLGHKTVIDERNGTINLQQPSREKVLGFWYNVDQNITFYIQENNGGLLVDIKTKDNDFVRYYPKKKDDKYTFTYNGSPWSFELKNDVIIDSKGLKFIRVDKPHGTQKEATSQQISDYNNKAKYYNAMLGRKNFSIKMSDVKRLKYIYSIMSKKQKEDAEPFPDFPKPPPLPKAPKVMEIIEEEVPMAPPPPPISENATPEQRAKYKAVIADYAKKHPKSVSKVKTTEGELIEVVEMPANALPPPPPPPTAKTGYKSINGKDYYFVKDKRGTRFYNRFGIRVDEKGNELNDGKQTKSGDVILDQYVSKVYKDGEVMGEFDTTGVPPPPPPPPAPPTMEEMAEKGATFYLEGKRISSKEAIKIVNNNKSINIQILYVDSKQPTVKLSKKGFKHKTKVKQQASINTKRNEGSILGLINAFTSGLLW